MIKLSKRREEERKGKGSQTKKGKCQVTGYVGVWEEKAGGWKVNSQT